MTWQEFELLIGEAFRVQGYEVTEAGGGGADGGVDLVLRKASEKFLVQCKQWRAFKVGVREVRELYGLVAAHGAAGGFVITSGASLKTQSRSQREGMCDWLMGRSSKGCSSRRPHASEQRVEERRRRYAETGWPEDLRPQIPPAPL